MHPRNIHFINPERTINKNENPLLSKIQTLEYFLNFGLYSIIQELENNSISSFFHDFQEKYNPEILSKQLALSPSNLVGISIVSAFNAQSAIKILEDVKKCNSKNITVIGGQHYIGHLKHKAFDMFPNADVVVSGEGEISMLAIAKQWDMHGSNLNLWDLSTLTNNTLIRKGNTFGQGALANKVIDINKIQDYTYRNYPNIKNLFPSIEYSRGCPHNCTFCSNTKDNRKYFRARSSESLKKSITDLLEIYHHRPLRFYLQASNFVVQENKMENFLNVLSTFKDEVEWRTEVRVDNFDIKYFKKLYDVGLKIIDIGLDSASKEIIEIMRKSTRPEQYLNKASSMLKAAKQAGIFTKINFLIHPGDTIPTLETSKKWLMSYKEYISAISICPALIFPGCSLEQDFGFYNSTFGTELIANSPLSDLGVFEVNPSHEVNLEHAKAFSLEIAQIFNSPNEYAYAKSFGYHGSVDSKDLLKLLPQKLDINGAPYA